MVLKRVKKLKLKRIKKKKSLPTKEFLMDSGPHGLTEFKCEKCGCGMRTCYYVPKYIFCPLVTCDHVRDLTEKVLTK